jgi:hypothetical protein
MRVEPPQQLFSRDLEVMELFVTLLRSKSRWVNLWGEYGVGKNAIAKILEYELRLRDMFTDGIFHFDLREISTSMSLRRHMGGVFGTEFLVDTPEFFKNKRMLIIFDGYERVLSNVIPTPGEILKAMEVPGIYSIFITEPDEKGRVREIPETVTYKINKLSDLESLQYLTSYLAHNYLTFVTFKRETLDKFIVSNHLRDCKGLTLCLKKNAARIFGNLFGIELEIFRGSFPFSSHSSPRLHTEASPIIEHELGSDFEEDLKSYPSNYQSEAPSMRDSKVLAMSKAKSSVAKKDGKAAKNNGKKRHRR